MDKRQMSLVGFMQAGKHNGLRRIVAPPGHRARIPDAGYYAKLGRTLEEGCFDMMFFDDRLAMPGIYGGSVADAVRLGARPVKLDLSIVLGVVAGVDRPDRPRRHLLDHLLLPLPRGPHLRHPRPPLRRPGGVEHRHLGQRQRGPELRVQGAPRPRRPLRPGRRVPRGGHRPVGHLGGRRPGPRPGQRHLRRPRQGPRARLTRASGSAPADRSPCRGRPRADRCCSRPGRRAADGTSPPAGPS